MGTWHCRCAKYRIVDGKWAVKGMAGGSCLGGTHVVILVGGGELAVDGTALLFAVLVVVLVVAVLLVVALKLEEESLLYPLLE